MFVHSPLRNFVGKTCREVIWIFHELLLHNWTQYSSVCDRCLPRNVYLHFWVTLLQVMKNVFCMLSVNEKDTGHHEMWNGCHDWIQFSIQKKKSCLASGRIRKMSTCYVLLKPGSTISADILLWTRKVTE